MADLKPTPTHYQAHIFHKNVNWIFLFEDHDKWTRTKWKTIIVSCLHHKIYALETFVQCETEIPIRLSVKLRGIPREYWFKRKWIKHVQRYPWKVSGRIPQKNLKIFRKIPGERNDKIKLEKSLGSVIEGILEGISDVMMGNTCWKKPSRISWRNHCKNSWMSFWRYRERNPSRKPRKIPKRIPGEIDAGVPGYQGSLSDSPRKSLKASQ